MQNHTVQSEVEEILHPCMLQTKCSYSIDTINVSIRGYISLVKKLGVGWGEGV